MIKVVMLDLGGTLVSEVQPFPFVPECLSALSKFVRSDGASLEFCLVSDFHLADPFTPDRVAARFEEYLALLDDFGLRGFFEPADRRITLSTHVNSFKPNRVVFTEALARIGFPVELSECLFITENAGHLAACSEFGMATLRFGSGAGGEGSFDSWPEGLVLIASTATPSVTENRELALNVLAQAQLGLEDLHIVDESAQRVTTATAQAWIPVEDYELEELDGINVQLPVSVNVSVGESGVPEVTIVREPSASDIDEAKQFIKSLKQHQQIEGNKDSVFGKPTHYIDTDVSGRRLLKRRGFQ